MLLPGKKWFRKLGNVCIIWNRVVALSSEKMGKLIPSEHARWGTTTA